MRKINFSEPESASWKRWVKTCDTKTVGVCEALALGETPKISRYYNRQKPVFSEIDGPFMGKCAYCEQYLLGDQQDGELDHYRPKGSPKEEDGSRVARIENGRTIVHPGYVWLGYKWNNLLLSCRRCNGEKAERFPVFSGRAWAPGEEINEEPKLINPCDDDDDPCNHLQFNSGTGQFEPKSKKGLATIELLKLNERTLPKLRRRTYIEVGVLFDNIFDQGGPGAEQELTELYEAGMRNFTSVVRLAVRDRQRKRLRNRRGR